MNTVAKTVEKDNIHRYRHIRYVNSPERMAKNEYQSLVSPIVRIGGLRKPIHSPTINAAITVRAISVNQIAIVLRRRYFNEEADQCSFAHSETTAPAADRRTAGTPNHMNAFHVISQCHYIVSLVLR